MATEFARRGCSSWDEVLYQEPEKGTMVLPDLDNLRAVTAFVRRHAASARVPVLEQIHRVAFENLPAAALLDVLRAPQPVRSLPRTDLGGRLCLVTGARGGIGRALCTHLRDCNARVVAVDVGPVQELVEELGLFAALPLDLSDAADIQRNVGAFMDK